MQTYRLDAASAQIVHLVLHERDERGHHYSDSAEYHAGHLKGDGLAASGGHQSQGVAAVKDRVHDLALERTERVVAPVAPQGGERKVVGSWFQFLDGRMSRIISWMVSEVPARFDCSMV